MLTINDNTRSTDSHKRSLLKYANVDERLAKNDEKKWRIEKDGKN